MTRSVRSRVLGGRVSISRQKGTSFESQVAAWWNIRMETDTFHRLAMGGTHDEGDVYGLFAHGRRVVQECKNHVRTNLAEWVAEAEAEAGNADALCGVVVHKRKGAGVKSFGKTYVTTTLETLAALITGESQAEFEERMRNGGADMG